MYVYFVVPFTVIITSMMIVGGKKLIGFILFPYGQSSINFGYHQKMNLKMCNEMKNNMEKVNDIVCKTLTLKEHLQKDNTMNAYGDKPRSLKKVIDYLSLFLEVNLEIVESNRQKV